MASIVSPRFLGNFRNAWPIVLSISVCLIFQSVQTVRANVCSGYNCTGNCANMTFCQYNGVFQTGTTSDLCIDDGSGNPMCDCSGCCAGYSAPCAPVLGINCCSGSCSASINGTCPARPADPPPPPGPIGCGCPSNQCCGMGPGTIGACYPDVIGGFPDGSNCQDSCQCDFAGGKICAAPSGYPLRCCRFDLIYPGSPCFGAPVPVVPPPPSPPASPRGAHVSSDCTQSVGWACDPSDYSAALVVHFYADGTAPGNFIGSIVASEVNGLAASQCGGVTTHGFTFPTPPSLQNGIAHTIYAFAINIGPGTDTLLTGSPRGTPVCLTAPPPPPPGPPPAPPCGTMICGHVYVGETFVPGVRADPLAGVTVEFRDANGKLRKSVKTDSRGYYRINP